MAFYGPKTGRLRELLTGVQALIAEHVGEDFRPYTLDQVHATLIALNGVRAGGTIVNEYLLEHAGERREMDLPRVMDILARRFAAPLPGQDRRVPAGPGGPVHQPGPASGRTDLLGARRGVRAGGMAGRLAGRAAPTAGRAAPRDERGGGAAPLPRPAPPTSTTTCTWWWGTTPAPRPTALARATAAVRDKLAADPADLAIGLSDVKIVAADSHTLAPPLYVSGIPAAEAEVLALVP